jgi:hypothetical protein
MHPPVLWIETTYTVRMALLPDGWLKTGHGKLRQKTRYCTWALEERAYGHKLKGLGLTAGTR